MRTEAGDRVRPLLEARDADFHAPMLCDVEVAAALRRAALRRLVGNERMRSALADYLDFPLERHPHPFLLERVLELRDNFSAYDAIYVALAERLGATLLSADERLVRAARRHTDVPVASW